VLEEKVDMKTVKFIEGIIRTRTVSIIHPKLQKLNKTVVPILVDKGKVI